MPSPRTVLLEVAVALTFAAVTGVGAFILTDGLPERFEATARLNVAADPLVAATPETYRLAPEQPEVLRQALRLLGTSAPQPGEVGTLRDQLRTVLEEDIDTGAALRLTVGADSATVASQRAEALAAAVVAWDGAATPSRVRDAMERLDARIAEVTERIRAEQVLSPSAAPDGLQALVVERDAALAQRERGEALLAESAPLRSLELADVTTRQIGPHPIRNGAAAAVLGAALSLLLGIQRTRHVRRPPAGRRVRSAEGAGAGKLDSMLLASFPRGENERDDALRGAAARLRSALLSRTVDVHPRVILLTSVDSRAGVTMVACRLAEELARKGSRTLLVDGDLWAPDVARRYGIREQGADELSVTSTLGWLQNPRGEHRVASVNVDDGTYMDVVPQFRTARPAPGTADALFEGLGAALGRWADYDLVLIDTAALTTVDDTHSLARFATGVLLVVPRGTLDERRLSAARKMLREVGTSLLGMVENDVPPEPKLAPTDAAAEDEYPRVVGPGDRSAVNIRDRPNDRRRRS